jgi:hypothetical protein
MFRLLLARGLAAAKSGLPKAPPEVAKRASALRRRLDKASREYYRPRDRGDARWGGLD